ncbi:hypothetical protein H1D32_22930 [Anaerobacillus sp. CMMVII]|uniref:hypothetical protein n=1 Tax=Anaerobacillus sp. CMMVII TaxID=2755588 RepID=UPI0021B75BAC|nr:hypothetical protein [Anaerobacillus sp. CMMVII]MCT8140299.1 hypothetical protein [Anaerobacillus sp. CMMVII]
MYYQKSSESEQRLYALQTAYEVMLSSNVHLTNAMNNLGKEHLLKAYANLHSASNAFRVFKSQIGIRSDDDVLSFYRDILMNWIVEDYEPTEDEFVTMIGDLALIYNTFSKWGETPGKFKERSVFDWDESEYEENVKQLKDKLILFSE